MMKRNIIDRVFHELATVTVNAFVFVEFRVRDLHVEAEVRFMVHVKAHLENLAARELSFAFVDFEGDALIMDIAQSDAQKAASGVNVSRDELVQHHPFDFATLVGLSRLDAFGDVQDLGFLAGSRLIGRGGFSA